MERTGGTPDGVGHDEKASEYIFCDCSGESPKGRRNMWYDHEGQKAREKEGLPPGGNVIDIAAAMGIEPLTEQQYRETPAGFRRRVASHGRAGRTRARVEQLASDLQ
jgi:hypothetical protein